MPRSHLHPRTPRRGVVVFSHAPAVEARHKGLGSAQALLRHALASLERAVAVNRDVDLVRALPSGASEPADPRHFRQRGSDFATRLRNAFTDARRLGCEQVVLVGGDIPDIDATLLGEAFAVLSSSDAVLGPSPDGGAYLIGIRGAAAPLLRRCIH